MKQKADLEVVGLIIQSVKENWGLCSGFLVLSKNFCRQH